MMGVAALSLPQALAQQPMGTTEDAMDQQSYNTQRATTEYEIQKQECDTLKYNQPQSYDACLQKAKATRDNLRAQGSEQGGQGSQGSASNQSGQSGQKQGPIEKVTSVVKEKLVDWGLASPGQGRGGQPSAGQQGQGSQQGAPQGQGSQQGAGQGQASQQGGAGSGLQASFNQQSSGAGSGQGGQNVGQQGFTQGQQFQGQQGQSGQGSFQGGNYGQQPQGQSWQQGTGGTNQQLQSGGTQGPQGSSSQQAGSTSGSPGEEEEHMDSVKYYQELARQQYGTLKQECNALKKDPSVYEQCQTYAKSIRDKITGMAEQNQGGG